MLRAGLADCKVSTRLDKLLGCKSQLTLPLIVQAVGALIENENRTIHFYRFERLLRLSW